MIRSMTAFANYEFQNNGFSIGWELRSVNHRYLDVFLRLPDHLRCLEPEIRAAVGSRIKRGKVDCSLVCAKISGADPVFKVDLSRVKSLVLAAEEVGSLMSEPGTYSALEILQWPGVQLESDIDREQLRADVISALQLALKNLVETREREGHQLATLIQNRCRLLRDQVNIVRGRMPEIAAKMREKLKAKLDNLGTTVDPERFEQEVVYLLQKMDIDEEVDRLMTHVAEVERVLQSEEPVGRRLDFLSQEMNREANTLGSKSVHTDTTRISVEMKVIIEQMREQVHNIE